MKLACTPRLPQPHPRTSLRSPWPQQRQIQTAAALRCSPLKGKARADTPGPSKPLAPIGVRLDRRWYSTPSFNLGQAEHCDAVILGGGVVGLALACSLAAAPELASNHFLTGASLRLVLLEASDLSRLRSWASSQESQSSNGQNDDGIEWENRVVSLTHENWVWLEDLGITSYLVAERIRPVTSMHITDGVSGAALDLGQSSSSSSASPLSHMVELSNLQQAMLRFIDDHNKQLNHAVLIDVLDKHRVEGISPDESAERSDDQYIDAWPVLQLAAQDGNTGQIRPRLLIGADGGSSPVRKYAGIDKFGWQYGRKGLVGTLRFDAKESIQRGGSRVAYQRFLPSGTIAWLPLSSSTASTVWTLPPDLAQTFTALHRATADGETSVLADLISAAWRLPWASLSRLYTLAASIDPASATVLRQEIKHLLQDAFEASTLVAEEDVPPSVLSVDARSVASFPLQVSHADSYLGSSLIAANAPSASSLAPANLVDSALSLFGLAGGVSSATADSPTEMPAPPRGRTVLIGDAAHSVHPLAGQGLNLGLNDARVLSHTLAASAAVGSDWGSHEALKAYERQTYLKNQIVLSAVDHLHWLYAAPVPKHLDHRPEVHDSATFSLRGVAREAVARATLWGRSTGVEVLNELDWVKARAQDFAGSKSKGGSASRSGGTTGSSDEL